MDAGLAGETRGPSFDVHKWGARGDGQTNDTQSIQHAIDACNKAGGGRVLLPAGRYLSGTLRLRSGVELHLEKDALLVGLKELAAYAGFESEGRRNNRWNRGLIVGDGLREVAITGAGVIDGNKVFDPEGEEKMRGPHTILLAECRDVIVRDITIRDSGNYAFLFYSSSNVRVENATFQGGWDGVHFRGTPESWNRDVRITGCKFFTGDDCIAGHYIEDAVVEDCVINSSCNGVRLIGPARRLTFSRCDLFGPGRFEHRTSRDQHRTNMLAGMILQPSAWSPTPGPMEDVRVSDVTMRNVCCALHVSIRKGNTGTRLTVERLKAAGVYGPAASVESWADEPFGEVTLRDVDIQYAPGSFVDPRVGADLKVQIPIQAPGRGIFGRLLPVWGFYGRNVDSLILDRVCFATAAPEKHPAIRVDDVAKLRLDHVQHLPSAPDAKAIELNGVGDVERDKTEQPPAPPRVKAKA